jgi:hypothetical protein
MRGYYSCGILWKHHSSEHYLRITPLTAIPSGLLEWKIATSPSIPTMRAGRLFKRMLFHFPVAYTFFGAAKVNT